jgi:hypothetical protein
MIGLLMGLGLGKRAAQLVAYVGLPLLLLAVFYLALDAYGDARYRAGKDDADAAWIAAGKKLEEQSDQAAAAADAGAAERAAEFSARLEQEKEAIDAAVADGGDPIDVLFPGGV